MTSLLATRGTGWASPKSGIRDIELEVAAGAGTYGGIDQITRFLDSVSDLFSEYRVELRRWLMPETGW